MNSKVDVIYCSTCNGVINKTDRFCKHCGAIYKKADIRECQLILIDLVINGCTKKSCCECPLDNPMLLEFCKMIDC